MKNDTLLDVVLDQDNVNAELAKLSYNTFDLDGENDAPESVIRGFKYVTKALKESEFFKDSYSIRYIREYIPFSGLVFRLFVLRDDDYKASLKQKIAKRQIISIYYDSSNALAFIDEPYYEIYDGCNIERFFEDDESNLALKALEILKEKY